MPTYFDTHSHLHFSQYDEDRDAVLARMREQNIWTIAVGTTLTSSKQAVALAGAHEDISATIGVHPADSTEQFDADAYKKLISPRVVAVGECGFDYYRQAREDVHEHQRTVFEAQIAFALEHDLPLMLHIRPAKGSEDAHEDALDILEHYQRTHGDKIRGNAHFFTSSYDIAKRYFDLGFTIAIPGVVTFASDVQQLVRDAPLDMLLSETDAPYAAPEPHRGKRNEPAYVVHVVEKIARLKNMEQTDVQKTLVKNAARVFNIRVES